MSENGDGRLIGLFDSGVGGLSIWREIAHQLPNEDTFYVADQAHVPYGSRALEDVQRLSEGITRFLLNQGAKMIVIACNTASAAALFHLRRTFPTVPFVGMEPAIKPATERTTNGIVGVIATPATFQGELFASLVERYAHDVQVITQVCPGLVEAVEAGALDTPETEALVHHCLGPLVEAGADQLVLGCTHYPFLRPVIERIVGPQMAVIDPAPAIARQARRVLVQQGLATSREQVGRPLFATSGDPAVLAGVVQRLSFLAEGRPEVIQVNWQTGRNRAGAATSPRLTIRKPSSLVS